MYGVLAVAAGAGAGACRRPAQQKVPRLLCLVKNTREEQIEDEWPLEMIVCLLEGASYGIRQL